MEILKNGRIFNIIAYIVGHADIRLAIRRQGLTMEMNMKVVVKIGTSTLTHANGRLNIRRTEEICKILSDIKNCGHEIIVVSSGAIAMGTGKMGLSERPSDVPTKQAAAAVGQCELMYTYDKLFSNYNHVVGQILITADDIKDDSRHANFSTTLNRLLELGSVPIINENDTVSTEEFGIGDNDTLAAVVAESTKADLLVLLSDIDGLFTADPSKDANAEIINEVRELTPEILEMAGGAGSAHGTGGMKTKLEAAKICMDSGCDMVITNGANPEVLYDIVEGKKVGTRFYASQP